ncbi:MAG: xylulokinase [Solirubrobacterales bacterium]|nr:xylulokinase [Solirubrobacterales bacterium]
MIPVPPPRGGHTGARLVGLDIGTSSVKGIAIDEAGTVLRIAERAYPLSVPHPGWAEQDPDDWVRAAREVLAELDADHADGIGLAGQMHGLVALGEDDRPLRPAILWNDGRTQAQCDAIEARIGRDRLLALTGNRALAGFTAPKLLWMAEHEPAIHARIRRILLPKDYVRLALCGVHATDVSDASGTLLFDVARRTWSAELVDALHVDRAWLPEALESAALCGHTAAGVPVAAGAGDQAAGALGVGVVAQAGPASIVLGTSGVVFAARDTYAADPDGAVHAFCHAVPHAWHVMGVMLSAAGSLRWLRDVAAPDASFDALLCAAAAWEPGAEGLVFAPYLAGERTPHADPAARAMFAGLTLRHDRGALVRAVLEGVAFGLADGMDRVAALGGRPRTARVSGGGSRGRLWLQIVAAVLDVELQRTAVDEGAAFGAALLGGVAGGVFADVHEAVAACVNTADTIVAPSGWQQRYAQLRPAFEALYPAQAAVRAALG